mgnify:CR=1 FL=1
MDIYSRNLLNRNYYVPNQIYDFDNRYDLDIESDLLHTMEDGFTGVSTYAAVFSIGTQLPIVANNFLFEKWYGCNVYNLETNKYVFAEWVVFVASNAYIPIYVTYIHQNGDRHKYIINRAESIYATEYPGEVFIHDAAFFALFHATFDYTLKDTSLTSLIMHTLSDMANLANYESLQFVGGPDNIKSYCYHNPINLIVKEYISLIEDIEYAIQYRNLYQLDEANKEKILSELLSKYVYSRKFPYIDPISLKNGIFLKDLYLSPYAMPINTQTLPLIPKYPTLHLPSYYSTYNTSHLCDLLATQLPVTDIEIICNIDIALIEPLSLYQTRVWADRYQGVYIFTRNNMAIETCHEKKKLISALNDVVNDIIYYQGFNVTSIEYITFTKTIRDEALLEFHPKMGNAENGLSVVIDMIYATLTAASLSMEIMM